MLFDIHLGMAIGKIDTHKVISKNSSLTPVLINENLYAFNRHAGFTSQKLGRAVALAMSQSVKFIETWYNSSVH